jgi:uncharacterized C2H2 Zn-finger protein
VKEGKTQEHLEPEVEAEPEKLRCTQCQLSFKQKSHLTRHINLKHGGAINSFLCDECGDTFQKKDYFQRHLAMHMKDKVEIESGWDLEFSRATTTWLTWSSCFAHEWRCKCQTVRYLLIRLLSWTVSSMLPGLGRAIH